MTDIIERHLIAPLPRKALVNMLDRQEAEIASLRARLDKAVGGLDRQSQGWNNALELGIISERHRTTANVLADEAQSLIKELRP